ncbi:equistatin-like [Paramacrobiotus metropolitanus]|uniref:equistatin-like n=1 Tax=Paramacrobiotus metropolitanus TaxID=2943436 RepID=UPI00244640F1|nr:equistatin-like [Paramacrobiotus metropolitanus]
MTTAYTRKRIIENFTSKILYDPIRISKMANTKFLVASVLFCLCIEAILAKPPKTCMDQGDVFVAGSNKRIQGWTNVGGCTCERARKEADKPGRIGGYIPQCDASGKFQRRQGWGSTGSSWCVDDRGNQISEVKPPGRSSNVKLNC